MPVPRRPLVIEARRPAALALATSRGLYRSSPAVVVIDRGRPGAPRIAARAARRLGAPVLLAGRRGSVRAVAAEVIRLHARSVVAVGRLRPRLRNSLPPDVAVVDDARDVAPVTHGARQRRVAVLVPRDDPMLAAARATVRAAGLPLVAVDGGDPRAAADSRDALRRLAPVRLVAIGRTGTFPAARALDGLRRTVLAGHELPGGGQLLFPGRRLVALYGHPGDANLGALGEQSIARALRRARRVARTYDVGRGAPVIPTFEIITTVASSEAGSDGDFSLESSLDHVRPWVDAAASAGFYVVLDLQPGRSKFLTQARRYEQLLVQPHVGLALDPEWRLARGERHLRDIGQVSAQEVNRVASWLAALTRRHALPQKLLLLQQFRHDMLPDREDIRTHPELALVVQMDGLGPQATKLDTWRAITSYGPDGLRFGWKNFYDEDRPLRSPAATAALRPRPVFVSYQ